MKTYQVPLILSFLAWFISPLQAVVWLQYDFDTQTRDESRSWFVDQSGNNLSLRFNRFVHERTDYPFASSHPELQEIDKSGYTAYGSTATSGSVQGDFSYINPNRPTPESTPNAFTMQGWVKPTSFTTNSFLFSLSSNNGGTSAFELGYTDQGIVRGRFYSRGGAGGSGVQHLETTHTLELNEWTHLAYVYTAGTLYIYVNGDEVASSARGRALPESLTAISLAGNINGYFDDFQIVGRALAAEELGYHQPFTIPEPKTVAAWMGILLVGGLILRKRAIRS